MSTGKSISSQQLTEPMANRNRPTWGAIEDLLHQSSRSRGRLSLTLSLLPFQKRRLRCLIARSASWSSGISTNAYPSGCSFSRCQQRRYREENETSSLVLMSKIPCMGFFAPDAPTPLPPLQWWPGSLRSRPSSASVRRGRVACRTCNARKLITKWLPHATYGSRLTSILTNLAL